MRAGICRPVNSAVPAVRLSSAFPVLRRYRDRLVRIGSVVAIDQCKEPLGRHGGRSGPTENAEDAAVLVANAATISQTKKID
jgi:hypothetical protein